MYISICIYIHIYIENISQIMLHKCLNLLTSPTTHQLSENGIYEPPVLFTILYTFPYNCTY